MPFSTIDKSSDYFRIKLYTGDGTTNRSITFDESDNMQPDFTWIKSRSNAYYHELYDVVRGFSSSTNGRVLYSNTTNAELTPNTFNSFNTNGFTVSLQSGEVGTNANGATFCAWNWKANGAGVSNTSGTISSTVSANTTSGFSIVKYIASGSVATIGHGLGVAPAMIIIKSTTNTWNWMVYQKTMTATSYNYLNLTNAKETNIGLWNNTEPTSSVFTIGTNGNVNYKSGAYADTYIAYCFAEVKGYSKAFSYTGNGSTDGSFVYCGFRPAFFLCKRTDAVSGVWFMFDNKRATYNVVDKELYANTSDAEATADRMDFLSNGFKCRSTSTSLNASGGTYVGIAFAESPFVSSKGVPVCAR